MTRSCRRLWWLSLTPACPEAGRRFLDATLTLEAPAWAGMRCWAGPGVEGLEGLIGGQWRAPQGGSRRNLAWGSGG